MGTQQHTVLSADGIECIIFARDEQPSVLQDNKQITHIFVLFCLGFKVTPCPGKKDIPCFVSKAETCTRETAE